MIHQTINCSGLDIAGYQQPHKFDLYCYSRLHLEFLNDLLIHANFMMIDKRFWTPFDNKPSFRIVWIFPPNRKDDSINTISKGKFLSRAYFCK